MEFNNKGNNKSQVNVNTRGLQLMNKEGFDPSTVIFGFWNDLINIKMHPALEPSQQTESSVYDYKTTFSASLTVEKAQVLLKALKEKIYPAIEKGEDASIGVKVGGNNMVLIGTGVAHMGEVRPFLGIFKNLDADNKSDSMICYEFKTSNIVESYDPKTGSCEEKEVMVQLQIFEKFLSAAINALTHADVHADRHVNKYFRDTLLNAVGVKTNQQSSFSTPTRNAFGGFNGNNDNDGDTNAPSTNLENDDDLTTFMS